MDTKILRLAAGAVITDNTKMSKQAKHQMLEFIQHEASDVQIKGLLMDGKVPIDFDKDAEKILNMRFENSPMGKKLIEKEGDFEGIVEHIKVAYLNELNPEVMAAGVIGGTIVAIIIKGAYLTARNWVTQAGRRCRQYKGNERSKCLKIVKVEGWKKEAEALQSGANKCAKSKDPAKCKEAIANKIAKLKKKINSTVIPGNSPEPS